MQTVIGLLQAEPQALQVALLSFLTAMNLKQLIRYRCNQELNHFKLAMNHFFSAMTITS
jgi:hypothetical protein